MTSCETKPGLVPVIAQDAGDGAVLMLAWADATALHRTLATGQAWYYSRSRAEHWRKGATSGHTQSLVAAYRDCDQDAVLYRVEQVGPACHTGERSCFYRPLGAADVDQLAFAAAPRAGAGQGFLAELEKIIADRDERRPEGSYVVSLLAHPDPNRAYQKVGEEGVEFALAAATAGDGQTGRERLLDEAADLVFHLLIAMRARGLSLEEVEARLRDRHAVR